MYVRASVFYAITEILSSNQNPWKGFLIKTEKKGRSLLVNKISSCWPTLIIKRPDSNYMQKIHFLKF